jgi:pilus assembly protein CpaF
MKTMQRLCLKELMDYIEEELRINGLNEIKNIHENKASYLEEARQTQKLLAIDGSIKAREFMQNSIYFLLIEKTGIINVDNIDALLQEYHIDYYENIYTGGNTECATKPIDNEIMNYLSKYSIHHQDEYDVKLQKLTQIIYQEVYGYGILDELIFDSRLNEVACTRSDYIWIQYNGIKRHIPNPKFIFKSEDSYKKIIENRLTSTAREEMNAPRNAFARCKHFDRTEFLNIACVFLIAESADRMRKYIVKNYQIGRLYKFPFHFGTYCSFADDCKIVVINIIQQFIAPINAD